MFLWPTGPGIRKACRAGCCSLSPVWTQSFIRAAAWISLKTASWRRPCRKWDWKRNPRLAALAYLIQLLDHCGIGPVYEVCVNCSRLAEKDGWFSEMQGGFICEECCFGHEKSPDLQSFHEETRKLWQRLRMLDFSEPGHFSVKGAALMELEQILHRYLVYQTEQPINSLSFIRQITGGN